MGTRGDFKALLDDLLSERAERTKPLSEKELDVWRRGVADKRQKLELQRRLILDAEAVQSLASGGDGGPTPVSRADAEASWRVFQARLSAAESADDDEEIDLGPFPEPPAGERNTSFTKAAMALAAVLLLAVALLAYKVSDLSRQRSEMLRPSLSTAVRTVYLGDVATRAEEGPAKLANESLVLRMTLSRRWQEHSLWGVSIADPAGRLIFSENSRAEDRTLVLTLHRSFFTQPGPHRVAIAGLKNGEPIEYDSFELEIEL